VAIFHIADNVMDRRILFVTPIFKWYTPVVRDFRPYIPVVQILGRIPPWFRFYAVYHRGSDFRPYTPVVLIPRGSHFRPYTPVVHAVYPRGSDLRQ
jgi:hypothetical protein